MLTAQLEQTLVLLLCSGPRVDVFVNFTLEPQPYKVGIIAMFQLRKSGLRYQADPAQGWKAGEWWSWDLKSMVSLYPCWSQLDLVCSNNVEGPFKGLLTQNSQQPCEVDAILQSYKWEILGPETSNIFPKDCSVRQQMSRPAFIRNCQMPYLSWESESTWWPDIWRSGNPSKYLPKY